MDPEIAGRSSLSRAWYTAALEQFRLHDPEFIIGQLTRHSTFDVVRAQTSAWLAQIQVLRVATQDLSGGLILEYSIPRMGRRVDAVLITGSVVFVIEFKVGAAEFEPSAIEQVWDYALDLKNFHAASHGVPIAPILVATEVKTTSFADLKIDPDGVYRPISAPPTFLKEVVYSVCSRSSGPLIDYREWIVAPYRPTPTIIEAARALYAQHSVEAIARNDAGAQNLAVTSSRVEEIIEDSRRRSSKAICFVTGVPGAGKTLVGLNVATQRQESASGAHAVYLTGNGPLLAVLREVLTRDELERRLQSGERIRKGIVRDTVDSFIQNVHHFRDDALADRHSPPPERVAIFDEAQRAWNLRKTSDFMSRKKGFAGFNQSEPEFLIETMNRHGDWATVVCLVGGGQEIGDGEAGIDSWLDAVATRFPDWQVHISSRLTDSEYAAGRAIEAARRHGNATFDDGLHLSASMRSFRAESVSRFIKALLEHDGNAARDTFERFQDRYPVVFSRNIDAAKAWVRGQARGSERFGLLASSKAQRLKPHAIDIRLKVNPVHWFLDDKDDTRSSFYLEDAATEFQVQGLELDWTCVTWDADLRWNYGAWSYHDFRGSKWTNIHSSDNRRYLLNAYRVLLTRARQGMVIFVPPGDRSDHTRPPEYYDGVAAYLRRVGVTAID